MAAAARSLSRMARNARPIRPFTRFLAKSSMAAVTANSM